MNEKQFIANLVKGDWAFPKTVKISLAGLNFLNSCLTYDPDQRMTLEALLHSPYITEDPRNEEECKDLTASHIGGV